MTTGRKTATVFMAASTAAVHRCLKNAESALWSDWSVSMCLLCVQVYITTCITCHLARILVSEITDSGSIDSWLLLLGGAKDKASYTYRSHDWLRSEWLLAGKEQVTCSPITSYGQYTMLILVYSFRDLFLL